jgi:glutamyl-tRNA synthetase
MTDPNTNSAAPIRVRIAPSPTGDPHVGTAYIGLLNYLYAKQRGGQFILRIEDTDRARFVATSEQEIFDSLHWLGLTWDEGPDTGGPYGPYRQSERTEIYREHVELLLANGTAYKSFETAEELEAMRKSQLAAKLPPRYNGAHRELTPAQIAAFEDEGRPFVIRLKVPAEGETAFRDELRGAINFSHNNVDDQVLMKSDGFPTYHLANVVDDHLMRITDVIRAEEWISSTPKHVLLYKAFGWNLPRFWHMPLLRNLDKSKISKRKNPVSLIYYRQAGFLPPALLNFLGLMGGGMPAGGAVGKEEEEKAAPPEIFDLPQMLEKFSFEKISLGGPVFDLVKLKWLNGEYIRKLTPDAFFDQLRTVVFSDGILRAIAPLVQTRIETLAQFGDLADFFFRDDVMPAPELFVPKKRTLEETLAFTIELLAALETADWTSEALDSTIRAIGVDKEWSVKENFMLLRAILTGRTTSPPLLESLIVFGKARSLDRVRRFVDAQKKLASQKR